MTDSLEQQLIDIAKQIVLQDLQILALKEQLKDIENRLNSHLELRMKKFLALIELAKKNMIEKNELVYCSCGALRPPYEQCAECGELNNVTDNSDNPSYS